MKHQAFLTVEQVATILPLTVVTIRRNAAQLGGFKIPGSRRWLFQKDHLWDNLSKWQQEAGERDGQD